MKIINLALLLLAINCNTSKTTKKTTMDKNSSEYKTYLKQEHRFEINGCELKYNDKSFYIGMSLEEFENIFGNNLHKEKNIINYKTDPYFIIYKEEGVVALFEKNNLRDIYIYIKNDVFKEISLIGRKNIMFNNFLLNQTDRMQDFLKKSDMNFDDFEISSSGYLQRYTCKKDTLIYDISSSVYYHRIGSGHMAISGDWKLDETNSIKYFHFYVDNEPPSEFQ